MKTLIIVIILIVIIIIGYIVFSGPEKGEVAAFMDNLKTKTGLSFSNAKDAEIEWHTKEGILPIPGIEFEMTEATHDHMDIVKDIIEAEGFEVDLYNIADGAGSLVGYKKGMFACTILWDAIKSTLNVRCGESDVSLETNVTREEAIQKLFADKYNTKASAVELVIDQETDRYVRGTIKIEGESKGIFLAAKVNDSWKLAFDGNGAIPCQDVTDFPEDMKADCVDNNITVDKDKTFIVVLDSNPTTGYSWQASFNEAFLRLDNQEFVSQGEPGIVGAGGTETFTFTGLKQGTTDIIFSYLRSWETDAIETKTFTIIIKGQ